MKSIHFVSQCHRPVCVKYNVPAQKETSWPAKYLPKFIAHMQCHCTAYKKVSDSFPVVVVMVFL